MRFLYLYSKCIKLSSTIFYSFLKNRQSENYFWSKKSVRVKKLETHYHEVWHCRTELSNTIFVPSESEDFFKYLVWSDWMIFLVRLRNSAESYCCLIYFVLFHVWFDILLAVWSWYILLVYFIFDRKRQLHQRCTLYFL